MKMGEHRLFSDLESGTKKTGVPENKERKPRILIGIVTVCVIILVAAILFCGSGEAAAAQHVHLRDLCACFRPRPRPPKRGHPAATPPCPPLCKYGDKCYNVDCRFHHHRGQDRVGLNCKYGDDCQRVDCRFHHPGGQDRVGLNGFRPRPRPPKRGHPAATPRCPLCKYGDKCYNVDCRFHHPGGQDRVGLKRGSAAKCSNHASRSSSWGPAVAISDSSDESKTSGTLAGTAAAAAAIEGPDWATSCDGSLEIEEAIKWTYWWVTEGGAEWVEFPKESAQRLEEAHRQRLAGERLAGDLKIDIVEGSTTYEIDLGEMRGKVEGTCFAVERFDSSEPRPPARSAKERYQCFGNGEWGKPSEVMRGANPPTLEWRDEIVEISPNTCPAGTDIFQRTALGYTLTVDRHGGVEVYPARINYMRNAEDGLYAKVRADELPLQKMRY